MERLLILFLLFISFSANANLDNFFKRYSFVRSANGELIAVRDQSLFSVFRIAPYLKHLQHSLVLEQEKMSEKGDYDSEIASLFTDEMNGVVPPRAGGDLTPEIRAIVASMRGLSTLDVDYIFNDSSFKDVIRYFEDGITKALMRLDPMVLARLDDPKFFYNRAVTVGVVQSALNYARKKLRNIPMLTVASYTILQIDELIRERRFYHQNVLLHYLELHSEAEIGITAEERNRLLSSIYESRIHWINFVESNRAKKIWDKYGVEMFYGSIRAANNDFRRNGPVLYSEIGERLNFAFQEVKIDGEPAVINLFDKESAYSKKFSVAFYPNNPGKIYRKRLVLQLAEVGINFVKLRGWYKEQLVTYMRSMYDKQRLTEGALFAYYESIGENEKALMVLLQNVNPYEGFEIK